MPSPEALVRLARIVGRLKTLPRQGWVDRGVPAPESVADHTFRAAMLAWTLGHAAGLDTNRLVKLMLIHDLAEAEVGDATPYGPLLDDVNAADVRRWREVLTPDRLDEVRRAKHEREAAALAEIIQDLPVSLRGEIQELAEDYWELRTAEARFAVQVDKVEALLQAVEYRELGHPSDVENFLETAEETISDPTLIAFVEALGLPLRGRERPDTPDS